MPTYEGWTRSRDEVQYVFFINPFYGLQVEDRPDHILNDYKKTHPYLYKVRVTLNNPAVLSAKEWGLADVAAMDLRRGNPMPTAVFGNPMTPIMVLYAQGEYESMSRKSPGLMRRFKDAGYDGIVITRSPLLGNQQYTAFSNDQIEILDRPLAGLRAPWPRWR